MQTVESPTHHITVSIDADSLKKVRLIAEARETSVSGLIRKMAQEEYLRVFEART
jgi:hypothetical protein